MLVTHGTSRRLQRRNITSEIDVRNGLAPGNAAKLYFDPLRTSLGSNMMCARETSSAG
jgi:hypothetical protein